MGAFDFLQDDIEAKRAREPLPKKAQDPAAPARQIPQHLQPHVGRRAQASKAVMDAFNAAIEDYSRRAMSRESAPRAPGDPYFDQDEMARVKSEILKDPGRAAELLELYVPEDGAVRGIEGLVKAYRGLLDTPEEKEYAKYLAGEDLQTREASVERANTSLADLDKRLNDLYDQMKQAVSARERAEIQGQINALQQAKLSQGDFRGEMLNREKDVRVTSGQQPLRDENDPRFSGMPKIQIPDTIEGVLRASGIDKKRDFYPRLQQAAARMQLQGFDMSSPLMASMPQYFIGMAMSMGPVGQNLLAEIALSGQPSTPQQQMAPGGDGKAQKNKAQDQSAAMAEIDARMAQKRQESRALFAQLGQSRAFQSVFDVLVFMAFSLTFGARRAAQHFLAMDRSGGLRQELESIQSELRMLDQERFRQQRFEAEARQRAAFAEMRNEVDVYEAETKRLREIRMQHQSIEAQKGKDKQLSMFKDLAQQAHQEMQSRRQAMDPMGGLTKQQRDVVVNGDPSRGILPLAEIERKYAYYTQLFEARARALLRGDAAESDEEGEEQGSE